MKTCVLILTTLVLACGCSREAEQKKIQGLENRVKGLEQMLLEFTSNNESAFAFIRSNLTAQTTNLAAIPPILREYDETLNERIELLARVEVEKGLQAWRDEVSKARLATRPVQGPAIRTPAPAPIAQAQGMKRGVPAAIYDRIAKEAERDWPSNFEMQEFVIKTQIEAYKSLQSVR